MKVYYLFIAVILVACGPHSEKQNSEVVATGDSLRHEDEKHLKNFKQLTFGGDNAEAYWSFDNTKLTFQSTSEKFGTQCDQIFYMNPFEDQLSVIPKMVSTGKGRTTCSYFMPGDTSIVYASTHLGNEACPPVPARREDGKYVWPIYPDFDIFVTNLEGKILSQLTKEPGYDAEATVSPKGDKIVFTSLRTGDLELFTMNLDGSNVKQVTHELGYDGGAFFSPDGSKLIFRASRPKNKEEVKIYKDLLKEGLVMPTQMELFICNVDGSDMRQLTSLGKANWCPFFHPSGNKVIFASNYETERGFPFNLYMINIDGSGLERITHDGTFDAFPMFSPDGKHLVFSSNRNNGGTRDTNLFFAEWVE